jgi:hypothetical protein
LCWEGEIEKKKKKKKTVISLVFKYVIQCCYKGLKTNLSSERQIQKSN